MTKVSFNFEVAAWTPSSTALVFIGASDGGRKVTVITKEGFGYTYDLGDGALIDRNSLRNIIDFSVGKYWVKTLKPKATLVDKDAAAGNWQITADTWLDSETPNTTKSEPVIIFNCEGLFAW